MSVLTKDQLDSLLEEMGPMVGTENDRTELGIGVYRTLFRAKPHYLQMFSRLQGLPLEEALNSDGIRYYGRALCESLVSLLLASTSKEESEKLFRESAQLHKERNVTRDHFSESMPIIMGFLLAALQKPENKDIMEQFLKQIFCKIADQI